MTPFLDCEIPWAPPLSSLLAATDPPELSPWELPPPRLSPTNASSFLLVPEMWNTFGVLGHSCQVEVKEGYGI